MEARKCKKCGGTGKSSKALMNYHNIQFPLDGRKAEFEAKIENCLKCKDCGHSWIPGVLEKKVVKLKPFLTISV